ncbi:hypothetical protein V2J09_007631 [Rumex salicifolius]
MAASRPRYTEVVRRQLSRPSPFVAAAAEGGLKLENLSYGQLQVLSAVPAQNAASALAADQQTSPAFYVGTPPPIMEGRGVVKKLWNGNVHIIPMHADWFCPNKVHDLEKQLSANLFSEQMTENYMNFRNSIVAKYSKNPEKRLAINDCLEMKSEINYKDANQIFHFLESWGIVNYCANAPDHEPLNVNSYSMEDSVQLPSAALNSIDCLIKFDNPKCSLKTPNGDDISELENSIKEKLAENRCKYCSKALFADYYQSVKEADVMLCLDCYNEGRFVIGHSSIDFSRLDCTKDDRDHADVDMWTDQETILLLEAMEMYNDNWHEIADHVGSKSKAQCILHFLRLPVANGLLSNLDVPNSNPNGKSEGSCIQDSDSYNRLPFLNFGNPVMALVAFLASSLGPKVAAASAHAALSVLSECEGLSLNPSEEKILEETRNPGQQGDVSPRYGKMVKSAVEAGLIAAAIKAKLEADQEEREIQWHAAIIASAQIKRLDLKLTQLTEVDTLLLKQCEQFEKARQKFVAERVIYMTTSPSISPTLANANALVGNRLMPASSSFMSMVSGLGNHRSNNMSPMQQPAFSFRPRLPFSTIQPLSSLLAQNDAFDAQGTGQSSFGHSVSRLILGTSSGFS